MKRAEVCEEIRIFAVDICIGCGCFRIPLRSCFVVFTTFEGKGKQINCINNEMHLFFNVNYDFRLVKTMIKKEELMPYANKQLVELIKNQTDGNVLRFAEAIGMSQQRINRILVFDRKAGKFPSVSDEVRNACIESFGLDAGYFVAPATQEEVNPLSDLKDDFVLLDKLPPMPKDIIPDGRPTYSSMVNSIIASKDALIDAKDATIAQLESRIKDKDDIIEVLKARLADYEKKDSGLGSYPFPIGAADDPDSDRTTKRRK